MRKTLSILIIVLLCCVAEGSHRQRSQKQDERLAEKKYFSEHHSEFMSQLDDSLIGPFEEVHRLAQNDPVYRATSPRIKWTPIQCSLLGMSLVYVRTIHKGKRNSVFLMEDENTGRLYAHKIFALPDEYTAELTLSMITADHPNMVQPICIKPSKDMPGILFEYITGQVSSQYVCRPDVTYEDVQRMSAQLLEAMEYVHYQGFIHADMKPDNIMITPEGNIKVIDFGFALKLPYTKGNRGTSSTMAPELVKAVDGAVAEGTDMWAYGATVAIWNSLIISRTKQGRFVPLVLSRSASSLQKMFRFGKCPDDFNPDLKSFLALFFNADPAKRAFNRLVEMQFLRDTVYLRDQFKERRTFATGASEVTAEQK